MSTKDEPNPAVSVVIVADYAGGKTKAWEDLKATLAALARQNFEEPTEFLLSECEDLKHQIPSELAKVLPSLRVVLSGTSTSYELKNDGVRAASGDIVALIDADCIADPGWLRHLVNTMRNYPDVAAVSGRTVYGGSNLTQRMLALLTRSYLDPGRTGRTRFISNNNAGYRRAVYLSHPLPTGAGPFAARIQAEAIRRSGGELFFEPKMKVVHDFEGWAMEADIRRNQGYAAVVIRFRDRLMPYAWLIRLGYASIPLFVIGKMLESLANSVRCHRAYGVRWYELPLAFCVAGVLHLMEIPGMVRAFRGKNIAETAYR